jgi:[CysO sulfur-carrier protein]-S-L-cysteine hydrolase
VLTEPQIQRYARQLLLTSVGEAGQEALGAVGVELALAGELGATAAAYLRAGGTEVALSPGGAGPGAAEVATSREGGVWAGTAPLLEASPRRWLRMVAAPATPGGDGLVVGERPGAWTLWSIGDHGCTACLEAELRELAAPDVDGGSAVQLGSLVALLVQRRALGLAGPLEGVSLSPLGLLSSLPAPECPHRPPRVPEKVLAELVAHLASALPDEGCAVLLGRGDAVRLVPMENAQAAHHARDPEAFPRSARTAFSFDPRAWLALMRTADAAGERVLAIAHSHPDGPDHFSGEDRRWAAPDGTPLLPGTAHLVITFRTGRASGARWAVWSDGDFREWPCALPAGA